MDTWVWVVIAVAAVVLLAALAFAIRVRTERHRSRELRTKFGSEYDRLAGNGSRAARKQAEAQLERRQMRREHLDIRPLNEVARRRYTDEWNQIQHHFVDAPSESIAQADRLLMQVMSERGYPVSEDFENQVELVSVDHPQLVSNYRRAHAAYERSRHDESNTEELRNSLVCYRSLFGELLNA